MGAALERDRQRPLSVRWASKPAAEYLKQEAGLSAGAAAIAFDLTRTPDQGVSYPRAKGHHSYACAKRYKRRIWTPGHIIGGMDELERAGLICHDRRPPGERSAGWQSSAQSTPDLVNLVTKAVEQGPLGLVRPRETIILRDADKVPQDYRDTGDTIRMRRNLKSINEAVMTTEIGGCEVAAMVRYFNRTWQRGGRLYAQGDSHQNTASAMRSQITIAGEATVEVDYKTLHPAILYSIAGSKLPADCYALDGFPRDLVKLALLVIINAKNLSDAVGVISHSDGRKWERDEAGNPIACTHAKNLMQTMAEPGSDEAKRLARKLIAELKDLHEPIGKFFGKDMGAELMRIDSRMAEAVMLRMLALGIMALPVHDSFLVQASKENELVEAMLRAAHAEGLVALKVERKLSPTPFQPKQLNLL